MKHKLLIASLLAGCALLATAAKDPVLMDIAGKKIKLSEFEYLYHKNSQQQIEKETLDQYVNRFVTYKRKVADAEAAGLDTLPAFISEFNGYKTDIVKPFLEDTTVYNRLVNEAYERMTKNVDIDHFMYNFGRDFSDNKKQMAFVDSLRTCVLNGESWESIVEKYSIDPSKGKNKGHYGFITSGVFPYEFEKVVYETPVGEISHPFRTDFGIHMVRVNAVAPATEVHAQHILKSFQVPRGQQVSDSVKAATKQKIDSIYAVVASGADFEEVAKAESDDRGTKAKGGELPWFGRGRMVPQFDKMAFEMPVGTISQPFETDFGYHIIKKLGERPVAQFDEVKPTLETAIKRDSRSQEPRNARIQQVKQMYGYKENPNLEAYLTSQINKHGQYDSTFVYEVLAKSNEPIFTFAKDQKTPVSALVKHLNYKTKLNNESAVGYIMSFVENKGNEVVMNYYADNLIRDDKDYSNLLNEYRDGMLLYEISNRKVWEGASRDTTGLNNYYASNHAKYTWDSPRFKGIILSAKNDSTLQAVQVDLRTMRANSETLDSITMRLHKKYNTDIKMERMTPMAQGENKVVDYLFFNGPQPDGKYPVAFVLDGGLIDQPQELNDVRGQVTSDYQEVLEKRWNDELAAKYPVKINKKVLKQIK